MSSTWTPVEGMWPPGLRVATVRGQVLVVCGPGARFGPAGGGPVRRTDGAHLPGWSGPRPAAIVAEQLAGLGGPIHLLARGMIAFSPG
jgi:hypothetical protein